jgi:hypothetical protein
MKTDEKKPQGTTSSKIKQEESKVSEEPINIKEKESNTLNNQNENINGEEQLNNDISQEKNNEIQIQDEEENKNQEENDSENIEEDLKFKFKEKLLTNEVHRIYGNRLREDYKYDNEGENGLFEASPRIVKIAGFELNKRIMTKISIINKSKYTERIIILPPTTPNFKIKYTKRGQIAPGLSETIYLFFTPGEYKYYTDNICINCPGNKIIIPIHAYPKMNIFVKEYIPKLIDFGNISIDTSTSKDISVKNLIDQNFKYKITPINDCKEIKIEKMEDTFYEMKENIIKITITPQKYGIFRGEYEFQVSEVDFQPYIFTIFATCNCFETSNVLYPRYLAPINTKKKQRIEKEDLLNLMKQSEKQNESNIDNLEDKNKKINLSKIDNLNETQKSENQVPNNNPIIKENLLTEQEKNTITRTIKTPANTSEVKNEEKDDKNIDEKNKDNNNIIDEKINKDENKEKNKLEESIASDITRPESKILNRFKDLPSSKEKEFLQYYNNNDEKIQAKEFKYIRFIGKEPLNEKETNNLLDERNTALQNIVDFNCKMDKSRHKPELDKEKCVIDRDQEYYLKPNFNTNQNDNFFKTRHYFKLLLKGLTKIIMRKRADDRLKKLNDMLAKHNIRNKDSFANYCDQDWIDFFSKDQQSANDDNNFNFMQMKFIPPQLLYREKIWLTNEYSINSLKQNIPHENNINLDEYDTLKELERNDLQVINYSSFSNPGLTQFDINLGDKKIRPSCESENLIREERGDTEFDPLKHKDYFDIAEKHLEHIYTEPNDLIFNNPLLKNYKPINDVTECSIDYNLQPRLIKECYVNNSSYQNDIYMKLNLSFTDNDKVRTRLVDNEAMFLDSSLNFNFDNMKKMTQCDEKDLYIKKNEKVDEDNFIFELSKDDDKAIVENIEKEDTEVKNIRDINKNGTFDVRKQEKINLENKFSAIKKKWMSLVPTYMEYINSGIKNPANKLMP